MINSWTAVKSGPKYPHLASLLSEVGVYRIKLSAEKLQNQLASKTRQWMIIFNYEYSEKDRTQKGL